MSRRASRVKEKIKNKRKGLYKEVCVLGGQDMPRTKQTARVLTFPLSVARVLVDLQDTGETVEKAEGETGEQAKSPKGEEIEKAPNGGV